MEPLGDLILVESLREKLSDLVELHPTISWSSQGFPLFPGETEPGSDAFNPDLAFKLREHR
jgi:hypothetical protein